MFRTPVEEILFTLEAIGSLSSGPDAVEPDLAEAVIREAGRFCDTEIAPLAAIGDRIGSTLKEGIVTAPPGWAALYRAWADGGWNGVSAPEEFGGQALPHRLHIAAMEIWNAGSMAFALAPMLTSGAVEALAAHGSAALKALYLPKMVSGEWTGTMNLTEPQAGSDLSTLRTRAERRPDGTYRIFGQKIYITWGEHDLTENIIHLVLARIEGAPEGTRGISLFLVPKFLPDAQGQPGARNDVLCHAIEEKLGIHASPTCTMIYGDGRYGNEPGAVGFLVGEENRGLACMFTMMNNARLAVGAQGVAIAEAATQKALSFARERQQGRAPGAATASPILDHPDIARTLLTMMALTQGARAITYACAEAVDRAHAAEQAGEDAGHWRDRAALLTPIAKSFPTDIGVEVASLGIQVHGGMGYVEETGAARLLRDARIAPIYEGTNGIQAIDLVTRKLPIDAGEHVRGLIDELRRVSAAVALSNAGFGGCAARLEGSLDDLTTATEWLLARLAAGEQAAALAGATAYQRLFGLVLSGIFLARLALHGEDERAALCRFFADHHLGETTALCRSICEGSESMMAARRAFG
ncbi:acyl-CoA dehydrogenase [Rhizobium sp. YIM 134829]|uniref:acyl-CoA dehydrogenase n=1 Tax=Rhizobium sp. YIM 134829 TaxID=3390453 RepID=UPI00397BDB11